MLQGLQTLATSFTQKLVRATWNRKRHKAGMFGFWTFMNCEGAARHDGSDRLPWPATVAGAATLMDEVEAACSNQHSAFARSLKQKEEEAAASNRTAAIHRATLQAFQYGAARLKQVLVALVMQVWSVDRRRSRPEEEVEATKLVPAGKTLDGRMRVLCQSLSRQKFDS